MNAPALVTRYRSVFISDTHLGTRGCRAEFLADFLSRVSAQHIYLVGDIIDGWRLKRGWFWDAHHDEALRLILQHARNGAEITYIPGNHDEVMRKLLPLGSEPDGIKLAGIRLVSEAEHVTATGQRLLVIHGDQFDSVICYARSLALLGDCSYTMALVVNRWFNLLRARFGYPYWSLSAYLKRQVKGAVKAIDRFETALAADAARRGFDGVVCGHIHHAEMRQVNGVLYINDGDWVESCTALVEHQDGRLELINWAEVNKLSFLPARPASAHADGAQRAKLHEPSSFMTLGGVADRLRGLSAWHFAYAGTASPDVSLDAALPASACPASARTARTASTTAPNAAASS